MDDFGNWFGAALLITIIAAVVKVFYEERRK